MSVMKMTHVCRVGSVLPVAPGSVPPVLRCADVVESVVEEGSGALVPSTLFYGGKPHPRRFGEPPHHRSGTAPAPLPSGIKPG
jgi:hypothetical protein